MNHRKDEAEQVDSSEWLTFEAWTAWSALMARTSVVFAWVEEQALDRVHAGSGVALRTQRGVPFVLTAAHVVEESFRHSCRMGLQNGHPGYRMQDFWGKRHPHMAVDVAIVVPPANSEARSALLEVSESIEIVEPSYGCQDADLFAVVGCPAEMLRFESVSVEIGFKTFHWMCDPREPPIQRDDDMIELPNKGLQLTSPAVQLIISVERVPAPAQVARILRSVAILLGHRRSGPCS